MAQQNIPDRSNLKVSAGKSLTADLWNRVVERLPSTDGGAGTSVSLINKTVVQCKAHRDIGIAEVLGVSDYLGVTDDVYEVAPSHVLELSAVVWPDDCHQIVIAERPVLTDEIGPFAYNGGAIVNLDQSLAGDYAFPDPADTTQMKRSTSGYRILNLINTSQAVVSLGDTQPLWKYELTSAYAGAATGQAKILTLNDGVFYAGPQTINFAVDCKPDSLAIGHVGYVMFADGEFWVTDFCSTGGGTETPRIRFRLENKFNDTGQALSRVLDTFGITGYVRGDQVVVNDPRKLFAHAIGYTNIAVTSHTPVDLFPCGGSVGYAVWTDAPDIDPPSTADYPRWEVEQCTQTVEKMRVFVYRELSVHSQPTGQTIPPEPTVKLYFSDLTAMLSRWPDVDYCESWADQPEGAVPYAYTVSAINPHRFSALNGSWVIIEKTTHPQRIENACNDLTPYAGLTEIPDEWVITEVEKQLARWIRVSYVSATGVTKWEYDSEFAEGDDPTLYFDPTINLDQQIQTAPGMVTGCLVAGEKGWAFWDPNVQKYNVVMTNSALYGSPVDVKILGSTDTVSDLLTETECTISYPEMTSVPIFGIKPDECLVEPVTNSISLANESIAVVTGYTIDPADPTAVCLNSTVIYVCKTETGPDLPCFDVCEPCEPTGCCEYPPGSATYTPGLTLSECDAMGGSWVEGDCPELCFQCYECNSGYGIKFNLGAISWDAASSTSAFAGGADIATAVWSNPTSGSDCCAKLTVTFTNVPDGGSLSATRVAEVCMQSSATCTTSHELVLDWDIATFDGCTLPTVLGCVTSGSPCVNEYGNNSPCIIPTNPSATGNWNEVIIHTLACDP